jgi:hypothetical protein
VASNNTSPELLIVMGSGATTDQTEHVVARLREAGADARVSRGREATVIGAIGEREALATLPLEGYPGVERVLPILKPYKLVARELAPDPKVIEVRGRKIGDSSFGLIAGPCTVEYREQTLEAARAMQSGLARSLVPHAKRFLPTRVRRRAKVRTLGAIDWARTKAFASPDYLQGVFVNLVGREPLGTVQPHELEPLKDEIAARFQSLRGPDGEPVTERVWRSEEAFGPDAIEGAPDLLPVLRDQVLAEDLLLAVELDTPERRAAATPTNV